jgi:hypothetical protein
MDRASKVIVYVDFATPDAPESAAAPTGNPSPGKGERRAEPIPVTGQFEFDFQSSGPGAGHAKWLADREAAVANIARKLNLPLGYPVEVWLKGGIRLRGRLELQDEILFIEDERLADLPLVVDGIVFPVTEIEGCVRTDI